MLFLIQRIDAECHDITDLLYILDSLHNNQRMEENKVN